MVKYCRTKESFFALGYSLLMDTGHNQQQHHTCHSGGGSVTVAVGISDQCGTNIIFLAERIYEYICHDKNITNEYPN